MINNKKKKFALLSCYHSKKKKISQAKYPSSANPFC